MALFWAAIPISGRLVPIPLREARVRANWSPISTRRIARAPRARYSAAARSPPAFPEHSRMTPPRYSEHRWSAAGASVFARHCAGLRITRPIPRLTTDNESDKAHYMSGFKEVSFADRQKAAQQARKNILEKFRAQPGADDRAVKQRPAEREAQAAARAKAKLAREAEKAAKKAEEARLAEEAAAAAAREKEEAAARETALEAERKAARDARYAARKKRK